MIESFRVETNERDSFAEPEAGEESIDRLTLAAPEDVVHLPPQPRARLVVVARRPQQLFERGLVDLGIGPSRAAAASLADDSDFRVRLEATRALTSLDR